MPFARQSIRDPTGRLAADCASSGAAPTMGSMRRLLTVGIVAVVLALSTSSRAGSAPIYHGKLDIIPSGGRIDRRGGGVATVKAKLWRFTLAAGTNGISPASERVVLNLGAGQWAADPGEMVETKKGGVWNYTPKAKRGPRAIAMLRLKLEPDGTYSFRFRITGADMSQLNTEDPVCDPFALIIGDDDAFDGVLLTSPSFVSTKLRVADRCSATAWPWA